MNNERDFIKVAAILSQRSKGAIAPVTRAEFIGQWAKQLQNVAAEVWDEVKKAQHVPASKALSDMQNELAKLGAKHTGRIDKTDSENFHFYTLNGKPVILRAFHTGTYEVYLAAEGYFAMDHVGIAQLIGDVLEVA